jgi:hypothetical protein
LHGGSFNFARRQKLLAGNVSYVYRSNEPLSTPEKRDFVEVSLIIAVCNPA